MARTEDGPQPHGGAAWLRLWGLLLGLLAACGGADAPRPDLVLIVLDTARVDRTSVYGWPEPTTPFLEQLARQGTRFDRAYSTSCWTLPAHASMFTGQLPDVHGADQLREHVREGLPLLAQRLAEAGYQTAGFTRNPWISSRTGLALGFEHFAEAWPGGPLDGASGAANPAEQGLRRWLAHERDPDRPAFVFVNLIRPHMPYHPRWENAQPFMRDHATWQAALERYSSGGPRALYERHYEGEDPLDAAEWELVGELYDGELRQVDEIVGRMLADLERSAAGRDQLVLVVSDHGENLGDHGHSSHMFDLGEPLTRVLLLARGPGFEAGAVDDRLTQLTDVYPTLLAAAGIEVPPGPGQDLRGERDPERLLLARVAWPRRWLANFTPGIVESGVLAAYERALWAAGDGRYKLVVGYLPMLALISLAPGFAQAFADSIAFFAEQGQLSGKAPWPWPWSVDYASLDAWAGTRAFAVGVAFLLLPAYHLPSLVGLLVVRPETYARRAPWMAATAIGAAYVHHTSIHADAYHLAQAIDPLLLGLTSLPSALGAGRSLAPRVGVVTLLLALSLAVNLPALAPVVRERLEGTPGELQPLVVGDDVVLVEPGTKRYLESLEQAVETYVEPDEPLFLAPTLPGLYCLLDREAPTWDVYLVWLGTEESELQLLRELQGVEWALIADVAPGGREWARLSQTHPRVWSLLQRDFEVVPVASGLPRSHYLLHRRHERAPGD